MFYGYFLFFFFQCLCPNIEEQHLKNPTNNALHFHCDLNLVTYCNYGFKQLSLLIFYVSSDI